MLKNFFFVVFVHELGKLCYGIACFEGSVRFHEFISMNASLYILEKYSTCFVKFLRKQDFKLCTYKFEKGKDGIRMVVRIKIYLINYGSSQNPDFKVNSKFYVHS